MTSSPNADYRPIIALERNNAGRLFVGVTEMDGRGIPTRSYLLSYQDEHVADSVMRRQFADMVRLMGANVQSAPIDSSDAQ